MTKSLEDRIRERAYELWEQEGRVHGKADEHWLKASLQVIGALAGEELTQAPSTTAEAPAAASAKTGDRTATKEAKPPRPAAKAASKKAPAAKPSSTKTATKAKKSSKSPKPE